MFRTAEGTKLAAAVLGRASFEIDGYDADAGEAWSVVLKGRATEIEQVPDVFDAHDLPLFPWHASPKHRFVRIEPVDISGRRFHVVDGLRDGDISADGGPRREEVGDGWRRPRDLWPERHVPAIRTVESSQGSRSEP